MPAVQTLRASITELCVDDHGSDPQRISSWLQNKTVAAFLGWLSNPDRHIGLNIEGDVCTGTIMVSAQGEIMLNYVAPGAQYQGISSTLLAEAEAYLCASGVGHLTLSSTQTAHRFYLARGWQDSASPVVDDGMISYPMIKACSCSGTE